MTTEKPITLKRDLQRDHDSQRRNGFAFRRQLRLAYPSGWEAVTR